MEESDAQTDIDELLFHYVGLKAQIRALQHETRDIYPTVVEVVKDSGEKHDVGGAVVSFQTRNRYKYSEKIQILTEDLKDQKKHEVETGIAEIESVTESVMVRFK